MGPSGDSPAWSRPVGARGFWNPFRLFWTHQAVVARSMGVWSSEMPYGREDLVPFGTVSLRHRGAVGRAGDSPSEAAGLAVTVVCGSQYRYSSQDSQVTCRHSSKLTAIAPLTSRDKQAWTFSVLLF